MVQACRIFIVNEHEMHGRSLVDEMEARLSSISLSHHVLSSKSMIHRARLDATVCLCACVRVCACVVTYPPGLAAEVCRTPHLGPVHGTSHTHTPALQSPFKEQLRSFMHCASEAPAMLSDACSASAAKMMLINMVMVAQKACRAQIRVSTTVGRRTVRCLTQTTNFAFLEILRRI